MQTRSDNRATLPSARPAAARRARAHTVPSGKLMTPLEGRTLFAAFTATSAEDLIADINAANATPAADTITLAPGATFQLTKAGLPEIKGALTIVGNGRTIERHAIPPAPRPGGGIQWPGGGLQIPSTPPFRLFYVPSGASLTLKDMTLRGGLSSAGAAVLNQGTLNLQGVTVRDNAAIGGRGESWWSGGRWGSTGAGGDAKGGGIYSAGTLAITGGVIRDNTATGGAGLNGWWTWDYSFRSGGPGGHGYGGGVYVAGGTASITNVTINNNVARGGAGGSGKEYIGGRWGGSGMGGGVFAAGGVVTLRTTTVTANAAVGGLGGTSPRYNNTTNRYETLRASSGQGVGGGAYITPAVATARMDAFSKTHITANSASTTSTDLFGSYASIV